jgi:hypothetical protein
MCESALSVLTLTVNSWFGQCFQVVTDAEGLGLRISAPIMGR